MIKYLKTNSFQSLSILGLGLVCAAFVWVHLFSNDSTTLSLLIACVGLTTLFFINAIKLNKLESHANNLVKARTAQLAEELSRIESERVRLLNATEAASIGLWRWDPNSNFLWWDQRMFQMYGLESQITDNPIPLDTWKLRVHPEDLEITQTRLQDLLNNKKHCDLSFRIIKPNGEVCYISGHAFIEVNDEGNVQWVVGLNKDETELKQSQAHLKDAQRLSKVGSWHYDLKSENVTWSEELYRIFGIDPSQSAPDMVEQRSKYSPESWHLLDESVKKIVSDGTPYKIELEVIRPDGSSTWITSRGERVLDIQGRPIALRGTAADITTLKEQQRLLREAREEAETANRAKSHFLSIMSHEIRTPLNAIVGTSYLLDLDGMNDKQSADLQTINSSSKSLLNLINDLLDFSKIEAGKIKINKQPFSLQEVLDDLRSMFSNLAAEKSLDLSISDLPDGLPTMIGGDSQRIKQILTNLLSNAIKFTSKGQVDLKISEYANETTSQVFLRFQVVDTGIGISADSFPKLFTPYTQADSSTSQKFGGTGLGLFIVRKLTELMKGELRLESHVGQGTTVTVDLELAKCDEILEGNLNSNKNFYQLSIPGVAYNLKDTRIMVVDDNALNLEITERILEHEGVEVVLCESGQEALQILNKDKTFNLVLMDLRMPGMDGFETTRQIRQTISQTLPILALTSGSDNLAKGRALASGMNGFLTKPIDPSVLLGAASEHIAMQLRV